jgi:rhodanese-related sulfurtransferase
MAAWGGIIMEKVWLIAVLVMGWLFMGPGSSGAMAPEDLKALLSEGESVTVIDIRSNALYRQGHIQGAINVPASVLERKRLPGIGRVIVCGDGVRKDVTLDAVKNLDNREGIDAEILEGGYASWEALNLPTTQKKGLAKKRFRYLSYQGLERAAEKNRAIVLVDLRNESGKRSIEGKKALKEMRRPLTELSKKFPGLEIIKVTEEGLGIVAKGKGRHHRILYVMVDDGDGKSERVATRLFAAGVKRVAILTGGERTLRREGQPGLLRTRRNAKNM